MANQPSELELRGPVTAYAGSIEAKWTFEPEDLFEAVQRFEPGDGIVVTIEPGIATVELTGSSEGQELQVRVEEAAVLVRNLLAGPSLVDGVPFVLKSGPVKVESPDGNSSHHLLAVGFQANVAFGRVDIVYTDANGVVVGDTKQTRIERKKVLAEMLVRHRSTDPTLDRMVDSRTAAMDDPANELVHLGEVFEAFRERMAKAAPLAYKAHRTNAERLRALCNDSHLRQGRHRGLSPESALRDATPEELGRARSLAQLLFETYLEWLNRSA